MTFPAIINLLHFHDDGKDHGTSLGLLPHESDELIEEARRTVDDALQACLDKGITDWGKLKTTTKDVLSDDLSGYH